MVDRWLRTTRIPPNRLAWAGVITGVLVLSAFLGTRASPRYLILLVGAGAVAIFLRKPELGLLAIVVAGLTTPFALSTGTQTEINVTIMLLVVLFGLWLLDMLVVKRHVEVYRSRVFLPLLLLNLAAVLSFLVGQIPWFPASPASLQSQLGGMLVFVLSSAGFLLVAHQIRDLRWLQWLTWSFLAVGALLVLGRLWPQVVPFWRLLSRSALGSMFWLWLVSLSFSQAAFNTTLSRTWRLALIGLTGVTLFLGMTELRFWNSGWLPALVAIVVTLALAYPRIGIPLGIVGGLLVLSRLGTYAEGLITLTNDQYSYLSRIEAWKSLVDIIKVNPVTGLGPANYYWYTPLVPIMGYYNLHFSSHNQYVDLIAQTGILGLVCFLWFMAELASLGWRLRARVPVGFARAYVLGALGGLAGVLVSSMLGDWFLPFIYNIGLAGMRASILGWLFLGGLVALERMYVPAVGSSPSKSQHSKESP